MKYYILYKFIQRNPKIEPTLKSGNIGIISTGCTLGLV